MKATEIQPGVFEMSMSDYVAHPAVSRTNLVQALISPAHALASIRFPPDTTDPMRLGTATHMASLEPTEVPKHFAIYKGKPNKDGELPKTIVRRGEHWQRHVENALSQGMDPHLTLSQYELALSMGEALRTNPVSGKLLSRRPCRSEVTIVFFLEASGVEIPIKVRLDHLIEDDYPTQADLKTASGVDDRTFTKHIVDYGYDIQSWLYRKAFVLQTDVEVTNSVIAAVEKDKGIVMNGKLTHAVRVFEMEPWLKGGEQRAMKALSVIAEARRTGRWPSYPERVERLEVPDWYRKQWGLKHN